MKDEAILSKWREVAQEHGFDTAFTDQLDAPALDAFEGIILAFGRALLNGKRILTLAEANGQGRVQ